MPAIPSDTKRRLLTPRRVRDDTLMATCRKLLCSGCQDGPVVISCHTKNLQDQLFYKDLPIIAEALDIPVKAVKLKGRNNYICLTRLNWLIADASKALSAREIEKILPLLVWLEWTNTGDLSECNGFWNSRPGKIAFLVQSESGFCTTKLCARNNGCFFGRVRRDLYEASIIIVNHALLLSEISMPGFLPMFNTVIIVKKSKNNLFSSKKSVKNCHKINKKLQKIFHFIPFLLLSKKTCWPTN